MINGKKIAVVVPAWNEEVQIGRVIESMPSFVDRIVVVNDCSGDKTAEVVKSLIKSRHNDSGIVLDIRKADESIYNEAGRLLEELYKREESLFPPSEIMNENPLSDRIILITNLINAGVGGSIARGYKWCRDHEIDCTAVMAGDGQMDPGELESICTPVVCDGVDYVKGNRLRHRTANLVIPRTRFLGNSVLSLITKIASGYWRVSDTQTGYTAVSLNALRSIKLHQIYRRYGMPNDMLVKLNIAYCTIREVPVKPVYRIGEKSKMKIWKVIPSISWLLLSSFFKRLWIKYLIKDFHPLFILYHLSFLLLIASIPFAVNILNYYLVHPAGERPILNSIMFMFLVVSAVQSLLFAMWMDIQDNERLYK